MTEAIEIAVLAGVGLVAALVAWWKRGDERWRPFLGMGLMTCAGLIIFAAAYLWVFTSAGCSDKGQVACVANQNEGSLGLVAAVIAVVALWGGKLEREADRRRRLRAARAFARSAVEAAVGEVIHNLMHVALVYGDGGQWSGNLPQLQVQAVGGLMDVSLRGQVPKELVSHAERILRNWDHFERNATAASAPAPEGPWGLEAMVNQSLHFLLSAVISKTDGADQIRTTQRLRDLTVVEAEAHAAGSYYLEFRSSGAAHDLADIRSRGIPLVCWCDDAQFPEVATHPFRRAFEDLARAHHH